MAGNDVTKSLVDERTRLLETDSSSDGSCNNSFIDNPLPSSTYGTSAEPDQERCDQAVIAGEPVRKAYSNRFIARIILTLLVGVFTGNADGSLVIATHPVIASEFNDLENSTWIFISFLLAGAATQSLYGKLSDIYGRKSVLLTSYALFAVGSGVGQSMWQVIVGRVISGSGGSGIMTLAAIIITDLAPLRDVASWQSYLNVVATVGRSLGGPTGGLLADTIGWRWSFLGQAPIFLLAMVLCGMTLPNLMPERSRTSAEIRKSRLARIDFLGASLLGGGLLSVLLPLKIAGQKVSWGSPVVLSLFILGAILLALFAVAEIRWAKEPIFPLRLLRNRDVVFSYLIIGMMISVPLYFQVTKRSSSTVAGAHLIPAVIGNTIGGLITGAWIKRTGYFKTPMVFAGIVSFICYGLLILRWNGKTNWLESLYIFPGGFGTGISANAVFVALQAAINPADKAMATSGLYLSAPVGSILGMAACNAVMQTTMPVELASNLRKLGVEKAEAEEIIKQATARIGYLDEAPRRIAQAVSEAYVRGLEYSHGTKKSIASEYLQY
ncbi:MFS general substrate transporter [Daldinia bambusicola]|nr:MFS general substrate transporter [Daldinia bambusicola]